MRKILLLCLLGLSSTSFAGDDGKKTSCDFQSICSDNSYKLENIQLGLSKLLQQNKIADLSKGDICEEVIRIYNNKGKNETEMIKILDLLLTSNSIRNLNKKDNSMYLAFYYNCLRVIQYLKEHGFDFKSTQVWDCLLMKERSPYWMETLADYLCQKEEQEGSNYYKNLFKKIDNKILSSDNKKINIDALNGVIYRYSIDQADLRYLNFYRILCETYQRERVPQNSHGKNRWWKTLCLGLSNEIQKKKYMHEENLTKCNEILKDVEDRKIENETLTRNINQVIKIEKDAETAYQELFNTLWEIVGKLNRLNV